jgi:transposase, IS30 family
VRPWIYCQLNAEERFTIASLRMYGISVPQIAAVIKRHRSTVWREVRRNCAPYDGGYRSARAHERAGARRKRSRRNRRFGPAELKQVEQLLQKKWSPEQIAGHLRKAGELRISHETIYQHVWRDLRAGGSLHLHLRQNRKRRFRKRYRSYDSRGRLAGKRHISERPAVIEGRSTVGHWEIDTMMGQSLGECSHCILTLVERKTGVVMIGKMHTRTTQEANRVTLELMARFPGRFKTITADNGTEFHSYPVIEQTTGTRFYFATLHHSWERGTSENTNGLIRQYLPKRQSMEALTQTQCDSIAEQLNTRPRKRHDYKTPEECFTRS